MRKKDDRKPHYFITGKQWPKSSRRDSNLQLGSTVDMNLFWYRLLLGLAYPLVAYSGWKRCRKYQETDTPIEHCFAARFGRNPKPFKTGGIWVHAVSVGETRSIFPLLKRTQQPISRQTAYRDQRFDSRRITSA